MNKIKTLRYLIYFLILINILVFYYTYPQIDRYRKYCKCKEQQLKILEALRIWENTYNESFIIGYEGFGTGEVLLDKVGTPIGGPPNRYLSTFYPDIFKCPCLKSDDDEYACSYITDGKTVACLVDSEIAKKNTTESFLSDYPREVNFKHLVSPKSFEKINSKYERYVKKNETTISKVINLKPPTNLPEKNWFVKDGILIGRINNEKITRTLYVEDMKELADFVIEFDANLVKGNGFYVFYRISENNNKISGYSFNYAPAFKPEDGGSFTVWKWLDGSPGSEPISQIPRKLTVFYGDDFKWKNTYHHFTLDLKGRYCRVYIDNQLIMTSIDDQFKSGKIGFMIWDKNAEVLLKNVKLKETKVEQQ